MTNLAADPRTTSDESPEALELTQRALELRRSACGKRSVDVWNSLNNLASLREAHGRPRRRGADPPRSAGPGDELLR